MSQSLTRIATAKAFLNEPSPVCETRTSLHSRQHNHKMCRLIVFSGTCTRCGDAQTWLDLSQELSCLEAKNEGTFGECTRGINVDERDFDQECDRCTDDDEGFGDLDDEVDIELDMGLDTGLEYELPDSADRELPGKRPIEVDEEDERRRKRQRTGGPTTSDIWTVTVP